MQRTIVRNRNEYHDVEFIDIKIKKLPTVCNDLSYTFFNNRVKKFL